MTSTKFSTEPERRRYRKVYARLWTSLDFIRLSDGDKVMALYLLSGPQVNRIGFFRVSFGAAAEDLNITPAEAQERLERVRAVFGWEFDATARVLWIPSWWTFNPPTKNAKQFRGAISDLNDIPKTPLMAKFCAQLVGIPLSLHHLVAVWRPQEDQSQKRIRVQEDQSRKSTQGEGEVEGEGEETLDVALRHFQSVYPEGRRKGGMLVEQAFLNAVHVAGGVKALLAALENHKASEQWQTPKLIPGMDKWLVEELWRQRLPPAPKPKPVPVVLSADETRRRYLS